MHICFDLKDGEDHNVFVDPSTEEELKDEEEAGDYDWIGHKSGNLQEIRDGQCRDYCGFCCRYKDFIISSLIRKLTPSFPRQYNSQ